MSSNLSRALAFASALLFASCGSPDAAKPPEPTVVESSGAPGLALTPTVATIVDRAIAHVEAETSAKEIDEALKALTAKPHVAGSAAGFATAKEVEGRFLLAGLETRLEEFHVLLPYPEDVAVEVLRPYAYRASLAEIPTDRDYDTHTGEVLPPYLAYAADGDVQGPLVYANYGRAEDFDAVEAAGVVVRGAIVVARYGKTYRGAKVLEAARRGALAVVLYSDPSDDGFVKGPTYPDGPWRPKSGVQRGSVLDIARRPGDPLTPGVPAHENARRLPLDRAETLPPIPAVALSWGDAEPMLAAIEGPPAPEGFQGGLPFAYRLGGGRTLARVALKSDWRIRKIVNVIGVLRGSAWPEEEVVVGGHRDAWVRGAVDPCGGHAALLEAARVLGDLARRGVRPSRSIVFCSFDGEEFGLLGSVEHVEAARERLLESCVLYLNADASVSGPRFSYSASPELRPLVSSVLSALESAKADADAAASRAALTIGARPTSRPSSPTTGRFSPQGGGSDHVPFSALLAAPVLSYDASGPYGVYHSLFDTYGWMKRFGDPDFSAHVRVAKAIAATAFVASCEATPSYDFALTAKVFDEEAAALAQKRPDVDLSALRGALAAARTSALAFDAARKKAVAKDPDSLKTARAAKRVLRAQRAFLSENPPTRRPFYKNVLCSVDEANGYAPLVFPGIAEALAEDDLAAAAAAAATIAAAVEEWRRRIEVATALLLEI
jgi:N-acetylated-alpha-linked acidic dipeptidase